jgi:hypothetical protein
MVQLELLSVTDYRSHFAILDLSIVTVNGCNHIETILRESGFSFWPSVYLESLLIQYSIYLWTYIIR